MKYTLLIAGAITLCSLSMSSLPMTCGEDAQSDATTALMQAKLDHSQALLEGLATEDFDSLKRHAHELNLLSLENDWNVIQTGEYRRLSEEFRRKATDLSSAAAKKNLDGATLAYVGLTMKCVECHKYVRTVKVGEIR